MGREVFRYDQIDASNFVRVNQGSVTLEFFHTATYATAGASSATVAVAERGGFANGDGVYIGTDSATISSGGGTTGAGNLVMTASVTHANNDAVVLHTASAASQRSTWYDDPDFATGSTAAITLTAAINETAVFLKPGQYGIRFANGATTLRTDYHEVVEETDWVTVTPEHASDTAGIGEAIRRLNSTTGGTVYIPPGTYDIKTNINITVSNITLLGAGRDITILKVPNSTTLSGGANGIIEVSSSLSNIHLSDFTIDGNHDNNTSETAQGIRVGSGATDILINDLVVKNTPSRGIYILAGAANTRVVIKDNYVRNTGWRGIEATEMYQGKIINNHVQQTLSHGILVATGSAQDTDYSRQVLVANNYVNRAVTPTTAETGKSYDGYLLGIGGGSEELVVTGNILEDNSLSGGDDGIGWLHTASGRSWERVIIDSNVVSDTKNMGIATLNNSTVTNNIVYKSGKDGIRLTESGSPSSHDAIIISGNLIVDCNEQDGGAKYAGIAVDASASITLNKAIITNNIVKDTRGTKLTDYGIHFGASGGTINDLIITGNDLQDVLTRSVDWDSDAPTYVTIVFRDNITKDAYRGEATLSSGTVTVTNTDWPNVAGIRFIVSRIDINSSTSIGALEGIYNGTTALTINSYGIVGLTMADLSLQDYPTDNDAEVVLDVLIHDATGTPVPSTQAMTAPGAFSVNHFIFKTGTVTGSGSGAMSIQLYDTTANAALTAKATVLQTNDNTWFFCAGNGTAAASGNAIVVIGADKVTTITAMAVNEAYVAWNSGTSAVTGDVSKVYWEFIGTAD